MAASINFDNSYSSLPERFYQAINPSPVKNPELIKFNHKLANELGIPELSDTEIVEIFSGNRILEGSTPIAQAYAGHQFGHFVPQLGDGRAILLGEIIDSQGKRKDIQLKGSGRTAYSRGGDGRAWLGPVIREYIVSEAMHALGIPTTRSLAAISSGEMIYRETALPGAILTRVASSHIRIGTFEYFAARNDSEALELLTDYVIKRHYPSVESSANKYLALIEAVSLAQASLIAKWMSIGFVHGVMNTDNCSISAETIDYGPCAFMDVYDPDTVFSSIDRHGRYAYKNQANICMWNITCLAQSLLTLIDKDEETAASKAKTAIAKFKTKFEEEYKSIFLRKIGLEGSSDEDFTLVQELLDLMQELRADFTLSFRYLADVLEDRSRLDKFIELFDNTEHKQARIESWLEKWQAKLGAEKAKIIENMRRVNPAYIPRNHLVEEAITKAHREQDFTMMHDLVDCLSNPYKEQDRYKHFMLAAKNKEENYVTYCGT